MPDLGEARILYTSEQSGFDSGTNAVLAGLDRAGAKSSQVAVQMVQDFAQANDAVQLVGDTAATTDNQLGFQNALDKGSQVLGKIADVAGKLAAELNRAGDAADSLADRAAGAFGEVGDEAAKLAQQQIVLGFDGAEALTALQKLNNVGLEPTQQNLTRLENISAVTTKGIAELAGKFAELDRNADPKAVKALMKELGATTDQLAALGAKTEAGKVLTDTAERADAARRALLAFADTGKFAGAAERAADDTQRLTGEFELLKREVGSGSIALQDKFSPALRDVVGLLRSVNPELKGFIGAATQVTASVASLGLGALGAAAQVAILASNAQAVTLATRAWAGATAAAEVVLVSLTGTLGAVLLVVGSFAIGIAAMTYAIELQSKATEELLAVENKRAVSLNANKDLVGLNSDELARMGKTSKDVASIIGGLNDQAEAARNSGNTQLEAKLKSQIETAQRAKTELAAQEAAKKVTPPDDVSAKEAKKQAADLKKEQAEAKRKKAADDKAAEAERKNTLAQELAEIRQAANQKQITKQQEIDQLRAVMAAVRVTVGERRAIELEISRLQGAIDAERTAEAKREEAKRTAEAKKAAAERVREQKKAEADAKKAAKDAEQTADNAKIDQLNKQASDAAQKQADIEIDQLKKTAEEKQQSTVAQIEKELAKKLELSIREIEQERDRITVNTNNQAVAAAATEAAEQKIRAARAETSNQLKIETDRQVKLLQAKRKEEETPAKPAAKSAFADGAFGVDGLSAQLGETFGDKAVFARIAQIKAESNKAVVAVAAAPARVNASVVPAVASTPTATPQPLTAQSIGAEIASQIRGLPLQINLSVTTDGGTQTQTLRGSASELAAERHTFNPKSTPGRL